MGSGVLCQSRIGCFSSLLEDYFATSNPCTDTRKLKAALEIVELKRKRGDT
jgi:hypothetical protein